MKTLYTLLILLIPFVGFGQNPSTIYEFNLFKIDSLQLSKSIFHNETKIEKIENKIIYFKNNISDFKIDSISVSNNYNKYTNNIGNKKIEKIEKKFKKKGALKNTSKSILDTVFTFRHKMNNINDSLQKFYSQIKENNDTIKYLKYVNKSKKYELYKYNKLVSEIRKNGNTYESFYNNHKFVIRFDKNGYNQFIMYHHEVYGGKKHAQFNFEKGSTISENNFPNNGTVKKWNRYGELYFDEEYVDGKLFKENPYSYTYRYNVYHLDKKLSNREKVKCLTKDFCLEYGGKLLSAWKFNKDGSFSYSFSGKIDYSFFGNWNINKNGDIKIEITNRSGSSRGMLNTDIKLSACDYLYDGERGYTPGECE